MPRVWRVALPYAPRRIALTDSMPVFPWGFLLNLASVYMDLWQYSG